MIFESPRLIARRFHARDLDDFVAMRNNPEVARYQSWDSYTPEEGRSFIEDMASAKLGEPGWFQFALESKQTGEFIGDCGLSLRDENRQAQIGYTIAHRHWGKGYASEAVSALISYAFIAFGLNRISASVDPRNGGSCRVLEKSGFRREGDLIESEWFKGAWADDAIYAILRREWQSMVRSDRP